MSLSRFHCLVTVTIYDLYFVLVLRCHLYHVELNIDFHVKFKPLFTPFKINNLLLHLKSNELRFGPHYYLLNR